MFIKENFNDPSSNNSKYIISKIRQMIQLDLNSLNSKILESIIDIDFIDKLIYVFETNNDIFLWYYTSLWKQRML